ncbi:transmembrane protein 26-like [Acanthaster planci]|uniref:Transmembrane protein 26-like n=1 Tax=Acanthaster planci TaxID=133434 RepID=A0A8B7ZH24_ACAPL|nr:transmembrane protein 26-like [Acanthaster planci]
MFCPGVVVFLIGSVPAIWLLELEIYELRSTSKRTTEEGVMVDDVNKVYGVIIEWILITEQMLPLLLIVGRWLLPKGAITRDELSQLLLVYFATASDIIEFFDGFKEPAIRYNRQLVVTLLTLWSWSLLQFSLVTTATRSSVTKPTGQSESTSTTTTQARRKGLLQRAVFKRFPRLAASRAVAPVCPANPLLRDPVEGLIIPVKPEHEVREDATPACTCLESDVWSVVASIILQDGPFLVFRLTLITHFRAYSHTNIFFTCKNLIVVALQAYRVLVLYAERREKQRRDRKRKEKLAKRLAELKKQGYSFPPELEADIVVADDTSDLDPYVAAMLRPE